MDNLSSYSDIEIIFTEDVKSISEDTLGKITIVLNSSGKWTKLPFQAKSAKIEANPKEEDPGILYENSVSLIVPHQYLTDSLCETIKRSLYSYCLLRYTTAMGETFVLGGTDYPLQLTFQKMHPGNATKISGWQLEFTGKSTYPQREISDK